jgi:hypothetical protein
MVSDAGSWFGGAWASPGPIQCPTNRPRRSQHPPRRGLLIHPTPGGWGSCGGGAPKDNGLVPSPSTHPTRQR